MGAVDEDGVLGKDEVLEDEVIDELLSERTGEGIVHVSKGFEEMR